jgi:glucose-1-phosphate cytidylyltransferase
MKLVILAGGRGTRISEESILKPKPLIEIGGIPIIWHIMKIYSNFGIKNFIICCGYRGYLIKEYFSNYFLHTADVTINLKNNTIKVHKKNSEDWNITLIDTGENTQTGGRILRIKDYVDSDFFLTYGDGLANIDLNKLMKFHKDHKKYATLTAVQPLGRFGSINIDSKNTIKNFSEKTKGDGQWVNGGFFILSKKIFNYIKNDQTIWEKEPIQKLAKEGQLKAFKHNKFWYSMDNLRDKEFLENLWNNNLAPWKLW